MSPQNSPQNSPGASTSQAEVDPLFASKFPLAALTFDTGDTRRKRASKYARTGLPADVAATTAAMYSAAIAPKTLPEPSERINPHGDALSVVPRQRIIVPMIEPNVLDMARGYTRSGPRPQVTQDTDGVYRVQWANRADHEAATRAIVEDYHRTHDVVRLIGEGRSRLDSWHNPFLLIAVRHTYTDDTPDVTRWLCADGNAMLIGARYALAKDLRTWGVEHPFTDPTALWDADLATIRTVVSAARTTLLAIEHAALPYPVSNSVEQWADFMLPAPATRLLDVASWLYHEHNSTPTEPDADLSSEALSNDAEEETETQVPRSSIDWIAALDYFRGADLDLLEEITGYDPLTRAGRDAIADIEVEHDTYLREANSRKDALAARLTFAAIAVTTLDEEYLDLTFIPDGEQRLAEDPAYAQGLFFFDFAKRSTRRVWRRDDLLPIGLNTLRRYILTHRRFPDCDLAGIKGDLDNRIINGPLANPASDWFSVTAMWGLSYALIHNHLWLDYHPAPASTEERIYAPEPALFHTLFNEPAGQAVVTYYAECAANGDIPDNRIATLTTLATGTTGTITDGETGASR